VFADDLRIQFVDDVIIPLCKQYGKDPHEGWDVFQAAYQAHRQQHGSFARIPDRDKRMLERISYMMVEFFKWLYANSASPPSPSAQQDAQEVGSLAPADPFPDLVSLKS